MDRRDETFLRTTETGCFSETARRPHATQSAVTQQIASPGDKPDVRPLERDDNRMALTTPGRIAQRRRLRMRDEMRAFDNFVEEVAQLYLPERMQEKALRRTQMRQARAVLSAGERARQSADTCARLCALPEVRTARVLAGYLAFGDELDVGGFMRNALAAGCAVALPVTLRGPRLAFVRVGAAELDDPVLLPECLREPQRPLDALPAELEGRLVAPAGIDIAVLPGLAFDVDGTRLGYGGGYYDAWLGEAFGATGASGSPERAQNRRGPLLVGVGFDCQLLPPGASLPREPHDVPLDAIVTPSGIVAVARQANGA